MVALFSTLLKANEDSTPSSSSSSIPTVIQLYTSFPLLLQGNKTLAGHAILSYEAIEVPEDGASNPTEEESTLFGRARKNTSSTSNVAETPNLGVWNAHVLPPEKSNTSDSLLKIPTSCYYCMTVDLSKPELVEPSMTRMQEALVRYLIACPPSSSSEKEASTSLYDLRDVQFGLAPNDTPATTTAAPDESDRSVYTNIMICAIVPFQPTEDYQETQAQNLVTYHLRRFAAAIGATLVFVSTSDKNNKNASDEPESENEQADDSKQATLSLSQLAHVWRDFASGKPIDNTSSNAIYITNKDQPDELIESVLLRNANNPPTWDSSTDSLWKALPPKQNEEKDDTKATKTSGDDGWLQQLRDSLGTAAEPAPATTKPATPAKTDDAEVSSFFENLLKK